MNEDLSDLGWLEKDGMISKSSLYQFLITLSPKVSNEQVSDMWKQLEFGDRVSLSEFSNRLGMMKPSENSVNVSTVLNIIGRDVDCILKFVGMSDIPLTSVEKQELLRMIDEKDTA